MATISYWQGTKYTQDRFTAFGPYSHQPSSEKASYFCVQAGFIKKNINSPKIYSFVSCEKKKKVP